MAQNGQRAIRRIIYWFDAAAERILQPHIDDLTRHISESADNSLVGLTQTGHFHIACLHLNRPELISYRQKRAGEVTVDSLIREQEAEISRLSARVQQFELEAQELMTRLRQLGREEES